MLRLVWSSALSWQVLYLLLTWRSALCRCRSNAVETEHIMHVNNLQSLSRQEPGWRNNMVSRHVVRV